MKSVKVVHDGETTILRHRLADEGFVKQFVPDCFTVYDHFVKLARLIPERDYLGTRNKSGEFEWMKYKEADELSRYLGSALVSLDLAPGQEYKGETYNLIGAYSKNRQELALFELACIRQSLTSVNLYESLGEEAMIYIITHSQLKTICCSKDLVTKLANIKDRCPCLETVVQFEDHVEEAWPFKVYTIAELFEIGKKSPQADSPPSPSTINTFSYTSGSTGIPKGVMISYEALLSSIASTSSAGFSSTPKDVYLSFLPTGHLYERLAFHAITIGGGKVGFYSGNLTKIADDIIALKPTLFTAVPRVLNKLYDKVWGEISKKNFIIRSLFKFALQHKLKNLRKKTLFTSAWDFVFKRIKGTMGGRIRTISCGSAPTNKEILDFVMVTLSCPILEGYGQTESTGGICFTNQGASDESVGLPIPSTNIELRPVEGFTQRQIVYKGPICMKEYFKNDEANSATYAEDWYICSGDLGELTPHNTLKIVGRVKRLIKLSQGEYVAPEKCETIFSYAHSVEQIYVEGISTQNYLTAIVVPNFEHLRLTFDGTDREICENEEAKKFVWKEMMEKAKENRFNSLEKPQQIKLESEPFTIENGLLTDTLKLRIPALLKRYKEEIDYLYTLPSLK